MKKILWTGGAYLALLMVQLVCTILHLFLNTSAFTKAIVQGALLLLSYIPIVLTDLLLARSREELPEQALGIVYLARKQVSTILTVAVANLLAVTVSIFFPISSVIFGILALIFVTVCVVSVVLLLHVFRPDVENPQDQ